MPFQSEAQRKWMHAAEGRGEVPKGTAHRWEEHTPKGKKLPEHVKKSSFLERFTEDLMQKTASKRGSGTSMDTFLEDIINGSGAHAVETAGSLKRHTIKEALAMVQQTHPKFTKQAEETMTPYERGYREVMAKIARAYEPPPMSNEALGYGIGTGLGLGTIPLMMPRFLELLKARRLGMLLGAPFIPVGAVAGGRFLGAQIGKKFDQ